MLFFDKYGVNDVDLVGDPLGAWFIVYKDRMYNAIKVYTKLEELYEAEKRKNAKIKYDVIVRDHLIEILNAM